MSEEENKKIEKEEKKNVVSAEKKVPEEKKTTTKSEPKKETKQKEKTEKEAVVNGRNLPVSLKQSKSICKFIKNKKIDQAIADLTQVLKGKKAVPTIGEIGHKKNVRFASGSGKYPKKASEEFITLLKSLKANAQVKGLENPSVSIAMANIARKPFGKFGRIKRKRAHITIKASEKINKKKKKKWKKEK